MEDEKGREKEEEEREEEEEEEVRSKRRLVGVYKIKQRSVGEFRGETSAMFLDLFPARHSTRSR
jgi:hypothetical protein